MSDPEMTDAYTDAYYDEEWDRFEANQRAFEFEAEARDVPPDDDE